MVPADLLEYSEFNKAFLAAVKAAKAAGKTPEQASAELKLPEKFAAYAMGSTAANVTKIYEELTAATTRAISSTR